MLIAEPGRPRPVDISPPRDRRARAAASAPAVALAAERRTDCLRGTRIRPPRLLLMAGAMATLSIAADTSPARAARPQSPPQEHTQTQAVPGSAAMPTLARAASAAGTVPRTAARDRIGSREQMDGAHGACNAGRLDVRRLAGKSWASPPSAMTAPVMTAPATMAQATMAHAQTPAAAAPAARRPGSIEGAVIDRDTRRPIPDAVIRVGDADRVTVSRADGRFALDAVAPGVVVVHAEAPGFAPVIYAELQVAPGRASTIVIELARAADLREEVQVTAETPSRPPHVTTSSHRLVTEEVRRSAGSLGDINRFVQALPGLAPVGDARNELVVRGGSPTENLTLVDGIEVPSLSHFNTQGMSGGLTSMLNNELLESAAFLAGGFPAQYGNRLSSVLDLRLREGTRTRPTLEGDLHVAGASLIAEGPLASRGSWLVTARRSYYDLLLGDEVSVPTLTSYTAKVVYDLQPRHKLTIVSLGGTDSVVANANNTDDLDEPSSIVTAADGWRTVSGMTWQQLIGQRAVGTLAISDAASGFDLEQRDEQLQDDVTLRNVSTEGETTIKYDLAWQIAAGWHLRGGGAWKRLRRDLAVSQPFGVNQVWEIDPGRVPAADIDVTTAASIGSGYLQGEMTLLPRVTLTSGVRVDRFARLARTAVSPQAGLLVSLSPAVSLSVTAGRYHQQPEMLSIVAQPAGTRLRPMRADHLIAGAAWQPRASLRITLDAYAKRYRDYPVSRDYAALSLANRDAMFDMNDLILPLVSEGRGRARGIELLIKQQLARGLYGQVAYTFSRTEQAALDGRFRRGRYDTPHILTIVGGYRLGTRWEFSGRFAIASGHPYTPALLPASADQNRWINDPDRIAGERVPAYHRLDLRADRRFTAWGRRLTLFVELQNLLDRRGIVDYAWNVKTRAPHPLRQVQLLPIVGLNVEF